MGMTYGFALTKEQIPSLLSCGVDTIVLTSRGGATEDAIDSLSKEDNVVLPTLLALGQSFKVMLERWESIVQRGSNIVVLDMPELNPDEDLMDIFFHVLSYVWKTEHASFKTRQARGIRRAMFEGAYGRPRMLKKRRV